MDKISFTGIQNVGAGVIKKGTNKTVRVVAQLTDEGAKDLSEFKDVLERCPNYPSDNFLRIDGALYITNNNEYLCSKLKINDHIIEANDKNLPIFSKIAKLLTKIGSAPKVFPTEKAYLESATCVDNLDLNYSRQVQNDFSAKIEDAHKYESVKESASLINGEIKHLMSEFFSRD